MRPIAIFYHCVFELGDKPAPGAWLVVPDQMRQLRDSGLADAATEINIGVNGNKNSDAFLSMFPKKSTVLYHGPESRSENLTLVWLENWVKTNPGWAVLYFHSKGASHDPESDYGKFNTAWRRRMMNACVGNWRLCVKYLEQYEAVGCHWLTGQGHDFSQHYFGGNFYWVRSEFFATIPSIFTRARIKQSGIASLASRYEAEVILGNGPRLPTVKNLYSGAIGT